MLGKQNLFARRDDNIARDPRQTPTPVTATTAVPLNPTPAAPAAGSHAATPAANSATTPTKSAAPQSESRLVVGPDVKLKGAEILDCDTLIVEGRVEATMDSRVIQIAEHGSFSGKVGIDIAEIHGSFDGELVARGQLVIHATGRVSGKIRYGRILIEEGGEVCGDVRSLTDAGKDIGGARTPALSTVTAATDAHKPVTLATLS